MFLVEIKVVELVIQMAIDDQSCQLVPPVFIEVGQQLYNISATIYYAHVLVKYELCLATYRYESTTGFTGVRCCQEPRQEVHSDRHEIDRQN